MRGKIITLQLTSSIGQWAGYVYHLLRENDGKDNTSLLGIESLFDSARKAETAFYEAFEHADLRAMMEVWDTHSCACIHPMNDRIEGFNAISESWQLIFESNAQLRFYLTETRYLVEADLAVHQVLENISFVNRVERREAKMLATNVYRATAAGWKMVLHHASPAPGNVVVDNLH